MKLIYKHENMMVLHSMKNILDMEGIDCMVKNEHGHAMGAEFGLSNTLMELWLLNDDDYDKAISIVEKSATKQSTTEQSSTAKQKGQPVFENPWLCDKCGEVNEGNFASCWNCQNMAVNNG